MKCEFLLHDFRIVIAIVRLTALPTEQGAEASVAGRGIGVCVDCRVVRDRPMVRCAIIFVCPLGSVFDVRLLTKSYNFHSDEPNAEKECEKALSDALTASKESPEAYYGLANLRFIQKRVEEAKNALGSCLALVRARAKDDHKLYVEPGERGDGVNLTYEFKSSVALLCLEIGMTDAASELVELLLEEDDTVPATWYYGALCFNAANESAEARKCAQKALALLAAAGQGADPELRAAVQAALKQAETASAGAAGAAGAAGGAAMDTD